MPVLSRACPEPRRRVEGLVDRHKELAFWASVLERDRPTVAQLILLYGRRRVGKTVLLRHWAEASEASGLPHTYWAAANVANSLLVSWASSQPGRLVSMPGPVAGRPSPRCWLAVGTSSSWTSLPMPLSRIRPCSHRFSTPGTSTSKRQNWSSSYVAPISM